MSYLPYTPATQPTTTATPAAGTSATQLPQTPATATPTTTTAAYPYSAYHPSAYGHPTTPGAYTYAASAYQTGVTGYGWPYPYGYMQQHPAQAAAVQAQVQAQAQAHAQAIAAHGVQRPAATAHQLTTAGAYSSMTTSTAHAQTLHSQTPLQQRSATFSAYTPSYARERESYAAANVTTTGGGRGGRRQSNFKGLFTKELKNLMYGFGDDRNPANDTVNVMEEILIEYITDVCQQAAGPSKKARLSIDDLRRALSNPADAKKLARLEELLFMQEDIKRARAQFEESDIHNPKGI